MLIGVVIEFIGGPQNFAFPCGDGGAKG